MLFTFWIRLEETTPSSAKAEDTPPEEGNVGLSFGGLGFVERFASSFRFATLLAMTRFFEWVWLIFFFEISDEVVAQQLKEFGGVGFSAFNFCNGVVIVAQINTESIFKTFYGFRK